MPAVHPQDFSAMAVLQPQKVIHHSSHLWSIAPKTSSYESYHPLSAGEPEVSFWEVADRHERSETGSTRSSFMTTLLSRLRHPERRSQHVERRFYRPKGHKSYDLCSLV